MPDLAASLRPTGRLGLGLLCAGTCLCLVLCTSAVAAAVAAANAARKPAPAQAQGPARLWTEFPLGGQRLESTDQARPETRVQASVPAAPGVDRPSRLRPVLMAAFGVSVFASAVLLALALVTASKSATFYRWFLARREPPRVPPATVDGYVPTITHLVFVPTDAGYSMVEASGEPPHVGSWVHDGLRVSKVGPSPLPSDPRRCVYLERW
jgi:hypothetical protein